MFRITEIWAFCTIDKNLDEEGIIGVHSPTGWVPLIAADRNRLLSLRSQAQDIANDLRKTIHLKRFTAMTVEETIEPAGKGMVQ